MDARAPRLRFGDFELDPGSATLFRSGRRVRIQPQPLRVLTILVEHAGEVVSREELHRAVWDQATFVEFDQGLNYCVRQIRSALGDDASQPIFIETLKKRGYQFIASVERVTPDPSLESVPVVPEALHAVTRAPVVDVRPRPRLPVYVVAAALIVAVAVGIGAFMFRRPAPVTYTQLTSFSQAAFAPALSPDERQAAFIVGNDVSFPPVGEIYTKQLPDGEPIQRTRDGLPKYGVSFSPDGSQITYTVADAARGWTTESVPALGGEPRVLMANAAGLTWLDDRHVLFSEIKSGLHMGLVQATFNRSDVRDLYMPKHERGMAHYSYASPDRSSVLVVEMGPTGAFDRCRLVPFNGGSSGQQVGPPGACTSAAWSPDGRWMYFTAHVNGASHLWRQRFPNGEPQQITSGAADEEGIAMAADGRSVVAAIGIVETGVWFHGPTGDRPISPDGYASGLSFSRDGRRLYYLLRRVQTASRELWVTDLVSDRREPILPGESIVTYDVSDDGTQMVYSTRSQSGRSQLWLGSLDGRSAPRLLPSIGDEPAFGPDGDILFRNSDGVRNYLFDLKRNGSKPVKALTDPIINFKGL